MNSIVKRLIRQATPKKIKDFLAYHEGDEFSTRIYSQEGEDILLRRIFEHNPPGFYVDVGAHHPFRFSNTKLLYDKGWHGINIEPNPKVKECFLKFRSRDTTVFAGVSALEGELTYFRYAHPAMNTFDERMVKERKEKPISTETLSTFPLKKLLD